MTVPADPSDLELVAGVEWNDGDDPAHRPGRDRRELQQGEESDYHSQDARADDGKQTSPATVRHGLRSERGHTNCAGGSYVRGHEGITPLTATAPSSRRGAFALGPPHAAATARDSIEGRRSAEAAEWLPWYLPPGARGEPVPSGRLSDMRDSVVVRPTHGRSPGGHPGDRRSLPAAERSPRTGHRPVGRRRCSRG